MILSSVGKLSGEYMESVMKKKKKATMGRICRKGRLSKIQRAAEEQCHQLSFEGSHR